MRVKGDINKIEHATLCVCRGSAVIVSSTYKNILEKSDRFNEEVEEKVAESMEDKLLIWIASIRSRLYGSEYEEFLKIIGKEEPF